MTLRNKIQNDITLALKRQDKKKLEVLRFFNAQIKNKEIDKGRKALTDEEVIALLNNQIKKLKESLVFFTKGKREDLVVKTKEEIKILRVYLPEQLPDEDIELTVEKVIKDNPGISQPGPLIGLCVKALSGKADNKKIAQLVIKKIK